MSMYTDAMLLRITTFKELQWPLVQWLVQEVTVGRYSLFRECWLKWYLLMWEVIRRERKTNTQWFPFDVFGWKKYWDTVTTRGGLAYKTSQGLKGYFTEMTINKQTNIVTEMIMQFAWHMAIMPFTFLCYSLSIYPLNKRLFIWHIIDSWW